MAGNDQTTLEIISVESDNNSEEYESDTEGLNASNVVGNKRRKIDSNSEDDDAVEDVQPGPSSRGNVSKRRFFRIIPLSESSSEEEKDDTNNNSDHDGNQSDVGDSDSVSSHSSNGDSENEDSWSPSDFVPPDPYTAHLVEELSNKTRKKPKRRNKNEDDFDPSNQDVQEVSIHRISLLKFKQKKYLEVEEIETIIEDILKSYHETIENDNGVGNKKKTKVKKRDAPKYLEEEIIRTPKINKKDEELFEDSQEHFSIKIYLQKVEKRLKMLHAFGIDVSSKVVHAIIFYYRQNELFALTSGQAWNVVHKFADLDFPSKIAARILSQEGQIETTNKVLVGMERQNKKIMKTSQEFNPRQLLEICTSFIAEIREHASILQLSCFQKSKSLIGNPNFKVQVSLSSVRFLRRLKMSDFPPILNHMSKIANGEPTFQYPSDDLEELDTQAHQKYLTPNSRDESKYLDRILANEIRKAIKKEESIISQYDFCHKHIDEFTRAVKYSLFHKNVLLQSFEKCPSISDIITALQCKAEVEKEILHDKNRASPQNPFAFLNAINKVKLSYVKHSTNVETQRDKIINYMEGALTDREGRANWRVMSIWCTLRNEFLLIVHSQWLTLLQECLLEQNNPNQLPMRSSDNYEEKFRNKQRFIIWESADEELEKPFDILRVAKREHPLMEDGQIILYFVVHNLNTVDLSKIGAQIIKTAQLIKKENVREGDRTHSLLLQNFYHTNRAKLLNYYPSLSSFVEKLNDAKIIIAISQGAHERSLHEEASLKTRIIYDDLEDLIGEADQEETKTLAIALNVRSASRNERNQLLTAPIVQILRLAEYLDDRDKITSKLLIATKQSFIINGNQHTKDYIFDNIVVKYQSYFNTLRPKLEIVNVRKSLIQNDWKYFHICQIDDFEQTANKNSSI